MNNQFPAFWQIQFCAIPFLSTILLKAPSRFVSTNLSPLAQYNCNQRIVILSTDEESLGLSLHPERQALQYFISLPLVMICLDSIRAGTGKGWQKKRNISSLVATCQYYKAVFAFCQPPLLSF